jgi:enamine deaminase RidA (YjgF/YER057c/UK114 family)
MSTGGIEEQTKLVMDNLTAVLVANGMTMANVVSSTVYMKVAPVDRVHLGEVVQIPFSVVRSRVE